MKIGIKSKLVVSLLLANGLLAGLMYGLTSRSFDQGFLDYINQNEVKKLQPLIDELAIYHERFGGWNWVYEKKFLWRELLDRHLHKIPDKPGQSGQNMSLVPPPQQDPDQAMNYPSQPRQHRLNRYSARGGLRPMHFARHNALAFDPRVLLRDARSRLLIGPVKLYEEVMWLPVYNQDRLLGEIGVLPLTRVADQLDLLFSFQQKRTFAYIALGLVVIALTLALLLAHHLLKPLRIMSVGVGKLVAGDYGQAFELNRGDELGQLTEDLNLLARTLRENQTSRQQWIADISHELRTPVSILQGELEAIQDGVREANKDAIYSLQQEARRLGSLINDLHELSLSDLGALSYEKENIDLAELLTDFFDSTSSRINDADVKLDLKLAESGAFIFADAGRIEQMLNNLLQNTLRYTNTPGSLKVRLRKSEQNITLNWEDSAPSVSDEDLDHLFDRLYRVEKSRNRAKGGGGLGLSICKSIIEAHDGRISLFHSTLGGLGVNIEFKDGSTV